MTIFLTIAAVVVAGIALGTVLAAVLDRADDGLGYVSDRTLHRTHRDRDRSTEEPRAARRLE